MKASTHTEAINVRLVAILCSFTLILANTAISVGDEARVSESIGSNKPIAEIEAVPDSLGALVVVATLGQQRKFVVDTGSSFTMIDSSLRGKLGARIGSRVISTSVSDITADSFGPLDLVCNGIALRSESAICTELRPIGEAMGHTLGGVLGLDVLSKYVIELDLAGERVRLYEGVSDGTKRDAEHFRIYERRDGWRVTASLPDGPEDFLLDTGSGSAIQINKSRFDSLRGMEHIEGCVEGSIITAAGTLRVTYGSLDSIEIGKFRHTDIVAQNDRRSTIGRSYLRRFIATFDFSRGDLYLRPSADYLSGDPLWNRSGLTFKQNGSRIVVESIEVDSPADQAGFRAGDVILRVGELGPDDLRLGKLRAILHCDGKTVEVVTSRDGNDTIRRLHLLDLRQPAEDGADQPK